MGCITATNVSPPDRFHCLFANLTRLLSHVAQIESHACRIYETPTLGAASNGKRQNFAEMLAALMNADAEAVVEVSQFLVANLCPLCPVGGHAGRSKRR